MIDCKRHHLEARCRERGYSMDEVRGCIVAEDGDRITVDETHHAYPRPRPGLGDMFSAGLASVGITKERAQAVASTFGIKDCGCKKRQKALNSIGAAIGLPPGSTAKP